MNKAMSLRCARGSASSAQKRDRGGTLGHDTLPRSLATPGNEGGWGGSSYQRAQDHTPDFTPALEVLTPALEVLTPALEAPAPALELLSFLLVMLFQVKAKAFDATE